jgi:dCTP deaminase
MILTDRQILETYRQGDIVIEPFDEKQIQAATYDLRVGEQAATTTLKKVVNVRETGYVAIEPGDFGVITVLEIIRLGPQYVGRFGLRSKFARKGLIATTGPQVDPGYHGRLIIGITNLSPKPVTLSYGDDFLSLELHRLQEPSTRPYSGPHQDRVTLGPEEIESIAETEGMALSEVLKTLRSLSANVAALASAVKAMKTWLPIMITVGVAIIGIIVALKK